MPRSCLFDRPAYARKSKGRSQACAHECHNTTPALCICIMYVGMFMTISLLKYTVLPLYVVRISSLFLFLTFFPLFLSGR